MIEFSSEAVEKEFQRLPVAMILEYYDIALSFFSRNKLMTIVAVEYLENDENNSEVAMRIDDF